MRHLAFLVALSAAGCGCPEAPGPSDRDRLQGYWRVIALERGGAVVANDVEGIRFRDDCFILWASEQTKSFDARYSLEPHHTPRRIVIQEDRPEVDSRAMSEEMGRDVEGDGSPWRERRIVGIYKIDDGGRLTLSFIRGSDSPPWRFNSADHRECILMVLVKEK